MNTATAPAMMAVIAMTMTISISVTPRSLLRGRSGQSIGRIAHAVAVKNHGGVSARRPGHGHLDEKRVTCWDRPQNLVDNGDARCVILESGNGRSRNVSDSRDQGVGEAVVIAHVVIRRGRAVARFARLRA